MMCPLSSAHFHKAMLKVYHIYIKQHLLCELRYRQIIVLTVASPKSICFDTNVARRDMCTVWNPLKIQLPTLHNPVNN